MTDPLAVERSGSTSRFESANQFFWCGYSLLGVTKTEPDTGDAAARVRQTPLRNWTVPVSLSYLSIAPFPLKRANVSSARSPHHC